jgi:hypothetical protein
MTWLVSGIVSVALSRRDNTATVSSSEHGWAGRVSLLKQTEVSLVLASDAAACYSNSIADSRWHFEASEGVDGGDSRPAAGPMT